MKSSPPPGLPTWLFILTDVALLGAAAVVAWASPAPLSTGAQIAIVSCVLLGVFVGLVPLVVRQERQKNEALDQRQRALEALAETVRESAQQVSIATGSLNGIAELARRTLREAEQLPERLQERVSAFQRQLAEAEDGARAALEEELAALRTSELGRIEAALNQLARTASELTRLEAAAAKQVGTLQREATDGASKLDRALAAAREEGGALETRLREARASIATAAEEAIAAWREASRNHLAALDERISRLATAPQPAAPATAPEAPAPAELPPEAAAPAPRKPRKPRREEPVESAPTEAAPAANDATPAPAAPETETPAPAVEVVAVAPAPAPSPTLPETVAPTPEETTVVATTPTEPVTIPEPEAPSPEPVAAAPVAETVPSAVAAPVEPEVPPPAVLPRKRPARRAEPQPTLEFGFEDSPPAAPGSVERTLTSDGATRLLVTAYIGIGNRLFIRGDGPGLSWERGVPLQFISIGKWRWETGEAGAPIRFRIYKNDELECSALGEQVLDPGYLQEVTASF